METVTEHNPKMRAFKNQIKIEITSEGLRVQIIDQKNRPMFAVGSAVLEDYTKVILDEIGKTLNNVDNPISISGHTDALQYAGGEKATRTGNCRAIGPMPRGANSSWAACTKIKSYKCADSPVRCRWTKRI